MEEIASKMLKLCKEKEQEQLKAKNVGIDVTDCPFFNNSKCVGSNRECENYQNCIFRQLKRKEQECEELKAQNKEIKQEQADKTNSAYKQANDEIYQYIKT